MMRNQRRIPTPHLKGSPRLGQVWSLTLALLLALTVTAAPTLARGARQEAPPTAMILTFDGPVTPVLVEYLERAIQTAERDDADLILFQLNTPGGELGTTQDVIEVIRGSGIPIVVYVSPRGAIAGSAGTLITLAGHAAAMAPETAIGAASPVGGQGEDLGETLEAKLKESTKATIRSLTERRPPEAVALAEQTIDEARAVSAREALAVGLVDFIAADPENLLAQLDGFEVETVAGRQKLRTEGALQAPLPLSPLESLLQLLTNPNIVLILLTLGVQAVLIELGNPGGWVAGFIGVVALALATYGLGLLPVNLFGIVFLVTSFVLFALEVKAATHGALTAAGIASFIVGALVLFNSPATPQFARVSVPVVLGTALFTGGMFALVLSFALRAQRTPVRTGQEALVGRQGTARSELAPRGSVQVAGELWTAVIPEGTAPISKGSRVEVVAVQGVHLQVREVN